jgi:hypothetical protein
MPKYKQQYIETRKALIDLLSWATSSARYESSNPYMIPVIKSSMQTIAKIDKLENYLDLKLENSRYNQEYDKTH